MDLALEMGKTARQVRREMPERELYDWQRYAERRGGLPMRRIEVLLARIACAFDVGYMGRKNVRLMDYLETPQERAEAVGEDMENLFTGGTVVRRG